MASSIRPLRARAGCGHVADCCSSGVLCIHRDRWDRYRWDLGRSVGALGPPVALVLRVLPPLPAAEGHHAAAELHRAQGGAQHPRGRGDPRAACCGDERRQPYWSRYQSISRLVRRGRLAHVDVRRGCSPVARPAGDPQAVRVRALCGVTADDLVGSADNDVTDFDRTLAMRTHRIGCSRYPRNGVHDVKTTDALSQSNLEYFDAQARSGAGPQGEAAHQSPDHPAERGPPLHGARGAPQRTEPGSSLSSPTWWAPLTLVCAHSPTELPQCSSRRTGSWSEPTRRQGCRRCPHRGPSQ